MSEERPRPHPAWALAIPALVFLVYANSLGNGFHFDDFHSIVDNPAIKSLSEIPRFFQDATAFSTKRGNWPFRPLLLLTNALNYAAARLSLPAWHLTNLALHALNAFLVFLVAAAVFRLRSGAVAAGLLFALHPLNSQAVNYFSARASLLAAALVLTAFLAQAQARRRREQGRSPVGFILAATVLFALGMLAKEEAALFLLLALFVEMLPAAEPGRPLLIWPRLPRLAWLLPGALVLALFLGLRLYFHGALLAAGSADMSPIYSRLESALTEFISPWLYLRRFLWPLGLSVFPGVAPPASPLAWPVLLAAAGYAVTGWLLWKARSRPALVVGALWYLFALLPAMALALNVLIAEHHSYLALVGLTIALGSGLEEILNAPSPRLARAGRYLLAAVLLCSGLLTFARNPVWRDEIALWRDAVRQAPDQYVAQSLLGAAYAKDKRFALARKRLEVAVRLGPDFADAHNTLALVYLRLARVDEAEVQIREALRLHPDNPAYLNNLGVLLMIRERWPEAYTVFDRVLELDPGNGPAKDYREQVLDKLSPKPGRAPLSGTGE
jgi:tetratricopeptide (TPR) repeat protein